jgi:heme/copper-type cytochrome/quinol oxidase subunit 2
MSRRKNILIILIPVAILIVLFLSLYVFNVYGDVVTKQPENLFTDMNSTIKVQVVPINAFGWSLSFRKSKAEFIFIEGKNLVEIVEQNGDEGFIILRSLGVPGKVEINVKSQFSLLPNLVVVEILTLTG